MPKFPTKRAEVDGSAGPQTASADAATPASADAANAASSRDASLLVSELSWDTLFGEVPRVDVHLAVKGEVLRVAWRDARWKGFAKHVRQILGYDNRRWNSTEWRKAMGVEPVAWVDRVILLSRARLRARELGIPRPKEVRFVVLPDGQAISSDILWPPAGTENPLTRIPKLATLHALAEILREEKILRDKRSPAGNWAWSDFELAERLVVWFRQHGATDELLSGAPASAAPTNQVSISEKDIQNFRAKLQRVGLGFYLPTMTQRAEAAP